MTPKPTGPVPAAPGPVPQPPPQFGVDSDEISGVSTAWSSAAETIGGLSFSPVAEVVGTGSDTLAAARQCGVPATDAIKSISTRIASMASSVSAFSKNTDTTDSSSADQLNNLTPR